MPMAQARMIGARGANILLFFRKQECLGALFSSLSRLEPELWQKKVLRHPPRR